MSVCGKIYKLGFSVPLYSFNNKHPNWKGVGNLYMSYLLGIIRHAKDNSRIFNITIDDCWNKFFEQSGCCALTGLILSLHTYCPFGNIIGTASLDRIDSSKGYLKDNIQWIHKDLNDMKWEFSEKQFLNLCQLIYSHRC